MLTIDKLKTNHPALRVFAAVQEASLFAARFHTYLLLDGPVGGKRRVRVLASYRNGAPLLVEQAYGRGRIALLTTTVDRDWGDLAIRTSFLPLMHQLVLHLAHRLQAC